ncbi:MAG: Ig-like domain-containing protein [bacterium]|nr:Ig-like domain-containing protein [bacterium]
MTTRNVRHLLTAILVAVISSCGTDSPTEPITPPPPGVVAMTVTTGDTILTEGGSINSLRVLAERSDKSTMDVTTSSEVVWASSDVSLATVSSTGVVKALKPGSVLITATYKSVSGSIRIYIRPDGTPWDQLPWLSESGKDRVDIMTRGTFGRIRRFPDRAFPLKTWVEEGIGRRNVEATDSLWREHTKDAITHTVVSDSSDTKVFIMLDSNIVLPECGRNAVWVRGDEIVKVEIRISTRLECFNGDRDLIMRAIIAHEIGHGVVSLDHTPLRVDIMSPKPMWGLVSPSTSEVAIWTHLPKVQPGTKPIRP